MTEATTEVKHRSPNQGLGMVLFLVYFIFYAGFIALTVYDYKILGKELIWGINIAIGYGMGLIFAAVLLAVIYAMLAKPDPDEATEASEI